MPLLPSPLDSLAGLLGSTALLLGAWPAVCRADPSPKEITRSTVLVPMRDGVPLATDIYRQAGARGRSPALLVRTPYNKTGFEAQARRLATAGYCALAQDCRGRYASGGIFGLPYNNEGQDGYDAVEWLTQQPWCDGRVGMWGPSYMGSDQWLAAADGAAVTVLAPTAAAMNYYYNLYQGGAYHLAMVPGGISIGMYNAPPQVARSPLWPEWYLHLPLTGLEKVIGYPMPVETGFARHNRRDGFWRRTDASAAVPEMNVPAQHIVGYYDFMCRESVRAFQAMRQRSATPFSRRNQQLILGPWDHGTGQRQVADVDFGSRAQLDVLGENLKWFDRFLKPSAAGRAPFPAVRYFSMGDNIWHEADQWPPADTRPTAFYLHSGGHANTRHGDGRLDTRPPQADEAADQFQADPADPVPAVPARGKAYPGTWGPTDQQLAEDRPDVLVYSTPPLPEPLAFAGPLHAELAVSANTPDADWVVKILDVHPNGFAQPLASGILRGSFRDSDVKLSLLEPDRKYGLKIDLGHAAARIRRGHVLRIQVAGSCFPIYDRNANTGEGPTGSRIRVSTEHVCHTAAHPSQVVLPLLAEGKE